MSRAENVAVFTHPSYRVAMADFAARKSAVGVATWDSGEGWSGEGVWSKRTRKVLITTINPRGERM